ncbi:MAG: hypothetical protein M1830_004791 [Pleopsidium flavum]|nr:MAG: hypothetical protein M1830_004791 [Pleopsidium flavum]
MTTPDVATPATDDAVNAKDDLSSSRRSRFRFKPKRHHRDIEDDHSSHRSSKRQKSSRCYIPSDHRHHHRSKRGKPMHTPPDDPSLYDDTHIPNTSSSRYLNPDTAFRESLFDALADDEGAAFWEGVYGQPIHTYPTTRPGPEGELERMTDEDYTSFVRARMWEKSHGCLMEEKERREEARTRQREWEKETRRMKSEKSGFEKAVEESLRKGDERKRNKHWKERWQDYLDRWEKLKELGADPVEGQAKKNLDLRNKISWPVDSGRWKDVSKEEVENFLRHAPLAENAAADGTPPDLLGILKTERVRWHPDKIQQRFGSLGIDAGVMQAVTAVFQVIDRMWSELRDKKT